MSVLTSIFLVPLLGALVIGLIPRNYRLVIRCVALLATLVPPVLAVKLFWAIEPRLPIQFEQRLPWWASVGISFHVGADGLTAGLLLMGALVAFAATCLA